MQLKFNASLLSEGGIIFGF